MAMLINTNKYNIAENIKCDFRLCNLITVCDKNTYTCKTNHKEPQLIIYIYIK